MAAASPADSRVTLSLDSGIAPWTTDEALALPSHIVAMQDPIPSFLTFPLPPHDPVVLDTNQGIVKQNEFKKIYRAKHAKLAKAPPVPPFFYQNLPWRPLRSLRETQSYSVFPSFQNFKYVWLDFSIADIGAPWLSKTLIAGIFLPRAF